MENTTKTEKRNDHKPNFSAIEEILFPNAPEKMARVTPTPSKKLQEARDARDKARDALRVAEDKYREVSRSEEKATLKTLNDYYRGKVVLEYERESRLLGNGQIIKENFNIVNISKVVSFGENYIEVQGKQLAVRAKNPRGLIRLGNNFELGASKGTFRIDKVDRMLTDKQLEQVINRVRMAMLAQLKTIW